MISKNDVRKIALILVTLATSMMFFMAGSMKVTDKVHAEQYIKLDANFRNRIVPAWQNHVFSRFDYQMDPTAFKQCIGWTELIGASLLYTGVRRPAAAVLAVIMIGAVITHIWIGDGVGLPLALLASSLAIAIINPAPETLRVRKAASTPKRVTRSAAKKTPGKSD